MEAIRNEIDELEQQKIQVENDNNLLSQLKRRRIRELNMRIISLRHRQHELLLAEQVREAHYQPQEIDNDDYERENNPFGFRYRSRKSSKSSRKLSRKSSKSSRKSVKSSRKFSRKSSKSSRKLSRKSSKSSRKLSRKSSKSSRKSVKSSRKFSRKSFKSSRKLSRKSSK